MVPAGRGEPSGGRHCEFDGVGAGDLHREIDESLLDAVKDRKARDAVLARDTSSQRAEQADFYEQVKAVAGRGGSDSDLHMKKPAVPPQEPRAPLQPSGTPPPPPHRLGIEAFLSRTLLNSSMHS